MLGKTANGLFWMFRYIERAENTARLVDAGLRMALTRGATTGDEWGSLLATAGAAQAYNEKYDEVTTAHVVDFLLRDRDNPSSVRSSIESARNNARLVRTAVTREVWESINQCWMTATDTFKRPVQEADLPAILAGVKQDGALIRGALHGTMLRNDIFAFSRLGTFIERADNTARILDVKYYLLLPSAAFVGSRMDNAQWEVILRSVSAERSYRWLHTGDTSPLGIAQFLILDERMPRSLAFCTTKSRQYLNHLERDYGTRQQSQILCDEITERITGTNVETIFQGGLHEFLGAFISDNIQLANYIEEDFRFNG